MPRLALAALALAALAVSSAAGAPLDPDSARFRVAERCLSRFAPPEFGLPKEPAAADAAYCKQHEGDAELADLLAAARKPQPSLAQQWAQIFEAEGGRGSERPVAPVVPPVLAANNARGARKLNRAVGSTVFLEAAASAGPAAAAVRWSSPHIPYVIDATLSGSATLAFQWARQHIEQDTCVRFTPVRGARPAKFVTLRERQEGQTSKCRASGDAEFMSLDSSCGAGTVAHELMHVLGFLHEQSRIDRHEYIEVDETQLKEAAKPQYAQRTAAAGYKDYGGAFDFQSILMYPDGVDTQDNINHGTEIPQKVIISLKDPMPDGTTPAGVRAPEGLVDGKWDGKRQRLQLRPGDRAAVRELYGCPAENNHGGHSHVQDGGPNAAPDAAQVAGSLETSRKKLAAWFTALVTGLAPESGRAAVQVEEARGVGSGGDRAFRVRFSAAGAEVHWMRYRHDERARATSSNSRTGRAYVWRFSTDGGTTWMSVPGMLAADGRPLPADHARLGEELAFVTGFLPGAGPALAPAVATGVVAVRTAGATHAVKCASGAVRLYQQTARGFWKWAAPQDGETVEHFAEPDAARLVRVGATWDGRAAPCHNALNAALLSRGGSRVVPTGDLLQSAKCHRHRGRDWAVAAGSCAATASATRGLCVLGHAGDCAPSAADGCFGECFCAAPRDAPFGACQCLRPASPKLDSCTAVEKPMCYEHSDPAVAPAFGTFILAPGKAEFRVPEAERLQYEADKKKFDEEQKKGKDDAKKEGVVDGKEKVEDGKKEEEKKAPVLRTTCHVDAECHSAAGAESCLGTPRCATTWRQCKCMYPFPRGDCASRLLPGFRALPEAGAE